MLYETAARITGPRPRTILLPEPATAPTVTAFVPAYAPLNPRLMELYDLVADRLGLIRRSLDARRIRNGQPGRDMPYFGDDLAVGPRGSDPGRDAGDCADEEEWCGPAQPVPVPVPDPEGHRTGRAGPRAGRRAAGRLREGRRRVPGLDPRGAGTRDAGPGHRHPAGPVARRRLAGPGAAADQGPQPDQPALLRRPVPERPDQRRDPEPEPRPRTRCRPARAPT